MTNRRENGSIVTDQVSTAKAEHMKKVTPFLSLYEEVASGHAERLHPEGERAAIAIAVMTHDPRNLRHLSELWDTTEEQIRISIREGFYDPAVKQVGFEIFDRKKSQEKEEKVKNEKREPEKSVQERIDGMWMSLPPDLLTEHQKETIAYINEGKSSKEIAQILGITPVGVSNVLRRVRKKIAPYILRRGLIRIHSMKEAPLYSAAKYGSIDAGKILLSTYSTKPIIERYLDEQRRLNPLLIIDGYIPLSDRLQIAANERGSLSRKAHADHVIKKNGLLYVHEEYLKQFRDRAIRRKNHRKPTPDHKTIRECIPLPYSHEDWNYVYRKLLDLIKSGDIPAIKMGQSFLTTDFDTKKIVEELMEMAKKRKKRGPYKNRSRPLS
ncbi:MAG: hypothetical protein HZC02_01320 [Candidatus Levybacteria bacterium]|nr:hypothetical protein [Candidatus Levybacteria bacterium]